MSYGQYRFAVGVGWCFAAFMWLIAAFMLHAVPWASLTGAGVLSFVALVVSAASFPAFMLGFVRHAYEADLVVNVNFFTFAFGPAPSERAEKSAWVAARRVVASWLGIAVSMALLVIVETIAGRWYAS